MTDDRAEIIRYFLKHSAMTLATLNGPQKAFNGVTPLGMASWLGMCDVVCIMLEESLGSVIVDAPDSHGATPLMCEF